MKTESRRRPRWRSLNIIFVAGLALLAVTSQAHLTLTDHKLALIGTVALMYALVAAWVSGNAAALIEENGDELPVEGSASTTHPRDILSTPTAENLSATAYTPGGDR